MAKKLLIENGLADESAVSDALEPRRPEKSKAELQELFRQEIQDAASRDLLVREKEQREKLQAQYELRVKKMEQEHSAILNQLERRLELLESVIESVEDTRKQVAISAMKEMDAIVVQMCMEALYKISGERELLEAVVEKAVKSVSVMYLSGINLKLFVSEEVFSLFTSQHQDSPIGGSIFLDKSLKSGQIRIDDGTSITEAGLVEQLDNLRSALFAELRKAHAI